MKIRWSLGDTKFLFSCWKYFTRLLCSLRKYFSTLKEKFVSPHGHANLYPLCKLFESISRVEAELINKAWVFSNCLFIFSRFHYLPIKVFIKVLNSPQEISSLVWVSKVSHMRMPLSERQSCYGLRNGVKLATICHKFSFVLRPDEGKYWKVMFRKQKLFDNRPSWAVPNFHNWMWTTFQMLTKQE